MNAISTLLGEKQCNLQYNAEENEGKQVYCKLYTLE
jgi:hypothetical protein